MSWTPQCFETKDERRENLTKLRALSLDDKILYSEVRIKQFYLAQKGRVYVSFSGGKDSCVLLHMVRSIYPQVHAVFFDTGLEFPEIRRFAKSVPDVEFVRPPETFKEVIRECGYPMVGKEAAHYIDLARRGLPSGLDRMSRGGRYGYGKFAYLVDAPFKVSDQCCNRLKKGPSKEYEKRTGLAPFIGTRIEESQRRETAWFEHGENGAKEPKSNPLSIWTERDIWEYIRRFKVPYCELYDKGFTRTGCVFCGFGIMSDRDRFVRLKATHPKLWAYCMKPMDQGGLGMKDVLDFMRVPTGCEQTSLADFSAEVME